MTRWQKYPCRTPSMIAAFSDVTPSILTSADSFQCIIYYYCYNIDITMVHLLMFHGKNLRCHYILFSVSRFMKVMWLIKKEISSDSKSIDDTTWNVIANNDDVVLYMKKADFHQIWREVIVCFRNFKVQFYWVLLPTLIMFVHMKKKSIKQVLLK